MNLKWGILIVVAVVGLGGDSVPIVRTGRELKADSGKPKAQAIATFAAGCFWGVEAAFQQVKGVTDTTVGYMGGTVKNPSYDTAHRTGHREVCQVTYDPTQVSYEELVQVFFKIHKPGFYVQQGRGAASQYNSVIFYQNPEQERKAQTVRDQLEASSRFGGPIATAIVPAAEFWRAEEYHQRYAEKHGWASCRVDG